MARIDADKEQDGTGWFGSVPIRDLYVKPRLACLVFALEAMMVFPPAIPSESARGQAHYKTQATWSAPYTPTGFVVRLSSAAFVCEG